MSSIRGRVEFGDKIVRSHLGTMLDRLVSPESSDVACGKDFVQDSVRARVGTLWCLNLIPDRIYWIITNAMGWDKFFCVTNEDQHAAYWYTKA